MIDRDTMDKIFSKNYKRLLGYARKKTLGNHDKAEDLLMRAFARLMESDCRGGDKEIIRYMCRIMSNLLCDDLRRKSSHEWSLDSGTIQAVLHSEDTYQDIKLGPDNHRLHNELDWQMVDEVLDAEALCDRLTRHEWEVVRDKAEGHTAQEVAERCGKSYLSVKATLFRGRKVLREAMA